MKFGTLMALGPLPLVAYAVNGQRLANTFHIMADLAHFTAGSAMDIFAPTVDQFLPDVDGGFELITTAAENEVLVLSQVDTAVQKRGIKTQEEATPLEENIQKDVCEKYSEFVEVYQILLSIMIRKKGILSELAPTTSVRDVLKQVQASHDVCNKAVTALTQSTIPLVPICADRVAGDKSSFDSTTAELKGILQALTQD